MPDLTNVACPTCGMPSEIVERAGSEATLRCVLLHDFTITIEDVDVRLATPTGPNAVGRVVEFRARKSSGRPEWARRVAWMLFGALAALLLTRAPVAAIVLIPLSLPLIGVEAARKSWRPLAFGSRGEGAEVSDDEAGETEGRKAA